MSPSQYNPDKHHIGILRADGVTNVGMMLVEKAGVPLYSVFDDEYLANQFFTGSPGYGALPAEKELAVRQDDWRAGFGLEIFDENDSKRYFSSRGMDLRFKGLAIAGYLPATATKPLTVATFATLANKNFEGAATWTGGSNQQTVQVHSGTYSWLANNGEVYQDAATWTNVWRSRTFTFYCWVWSSVATSGRIGLNDGIDTTYSSYHPGNSAWLFMSVTKTLGASATRLRVILGESASNSSYFDDCYIGSPVWGVMSSIADYNDALYLAGGGSLSKLVSNGTGFQIVGSLPANITDLKPFVDDMLYVPMNTGNPMVNMNTGEAFSFLGVGVNAFQFIEPVHSASPTMWGSVDERGIRSNTTPNNASSWSAITNVDTTYNNITDLLSKSGALYIMKENRPYYLNSSGAVQDDLAAELEALKRSTSGKNAVLWKNKIYIPCGEQGLLETDGTTNTFLNPSIYCTNLKDFVGRVMAVAFDEEWLFVAVDNGTVIEIMAGREETIGTTTSWVWHPIAEITLTGVETMFVSTVYQKRLWILSTDDSDSIYYIPLPIGYGNILEDTNKSFATNVAFESPWLHGGFKDTTKAWPALKVTMGHTYDANVFFQAHYKTLSNSTYAFIANFKGSSTSMVQTNYLPNKPSDSMIRLRFTANTNNTSLTPMMHSYQLKGLLYPDQREIIACVVRSADEITLKDGVISQADANTIGTVLDEARTATWPITMYDINGDIQTVKLLPLPAGTPRWSLVKSEKGRTSEKHYNLLCQKVTVA